MLSVLCSPMVFDSLFFFRIKSSRSLALLLLFVQVELIEVLPLTEAREQRFDEWICRGEHPASCGTRIGGFHSFLPSRNFYPWRGRGLRDY